MHYAPKMQVKSCSKDGRLADGGAVAAALHAAARSSTFLTIQYFGGYHFLLRPDVRGVFPGLVADGQIPSPGGCTSPMSDTEKIERTIAPVGAGLAMPDEPTPNEDSMSDGTPADEDFEHLLDMYHVSFK